MDAETHRRRRHRASGEQLGHVGKSIRGATDNPGDHHEAIGRRWHQRGNRTGDSHRACRGDHYRVRSIGNDGACSGETGEPEPIVVGDATQVDLSWGITRPGSTRRGGRTNLWVARPGR